jgi:hypothetical protein
MARGCVCVCGCVRLVVVVFRLPPSPFLSCKEGLNMACFLVLCVCACGHVSVGVW